MQQCAEEEIHDNQEQQLFHTGHLLAAEQPFQLLHIESKLFVTVEWAGAAAPGPHDVLSVRLTEGDAGSVVRLLSTPSASPTPHATVPPRTRCRDERMHRVSRARLPRGCCPQTPKAGRDPRAAGLPARGAQRAAARPARWGLPRVRRSEALG